MHLYGSRPPLMSIFPNDKQQGAPYAEAHRLATIKEYTPGVSSCVYYGVANSDSYVLCYLGSANKWYIIPLRSYNVFQAALLVSSRELLQINKMIAG